MKDPVTPKPDPAPGRGKWITLAMLAALGAFMYVSITVKVMKHGF
jgi:hypothetical protein